MGNTNSDEEVIKRYKKYLRDEDNVNSENESVNSENESVNLEKAIVNNDKLILLGKEIVNLEKEFDNEANRSLDLKIKAAWCFLNDPSNYLLKKFVIDFKDIEEVMNTNRHMDSDEVDSLKKISTALEDNFSSELSLTETLWSNFDVFHSFLNTLSKCRNLFLYEKETMMNIYSIFCIINKESIHPRDLPCSRIQEYYLAVNNQKMFKKGIILFRKLGKFESLDFEICNKREISLLENPPEENYIYGKYVCYFSEYGRYIINDEGSSYILREDTVHKYIRKYKRCNPPASYYLQRGITLGDLPDPVEDNIIMIEIPEAFP